MKIVQRIIFLALCIVVSFSEQIDAKGPTLAIRLRYREGSGMFAMMYDVIAGLKNYETGNLAGFEVDFGNQGIYYEPDCGPNWWTYYWYPIQVGLFQRNLYKDYVTLDSLPYTNNFIERNMSSAEINYFIRKYFRLVSHIEGKVDAFVKFNFEGYFVIGVHYRGTDKHLEAPRVSYDQVVMYVDYELSTHWKKHCRIFVATDEAAFLDYMKEKYPDMVYCVDDAIRSTNGRPVHFKVNTDNYKKGEDALVDCLLLSRCNTLIRTSSNLSLWSTYFNLSLPVLELNQRHPNM